jgi:hypothetical protein
MTIDNPPFHLCYVCVLLFIGLFKSLNVLWLLLNNKKSAFV